MAGYDECRYAVYFNTVNKHVTVHRIDCGYVDMHNRGHANKQGGWGYFAEEFASEQFAEAISKLRNLPLKSCGPCTGKGSSEMSPRKRPGSGPSVGLGVAAGSQQAELEALRAELEVVRTELKRLQRGSAQATKNIPAQGKQNPGLPASTTNTDALCGSFDGFADLFEERTRSGIFTTEDSMRYLFFHSLLKSLGAKPNGMLLESPHPDDERKEIDMILTKSDGMPELVFEFKFHREFRSGHPSPRPMKAGHMFKDIFRLARYLDRVPDSRCFFVYGTDYGMRDYLSKPTNNLADFFNLRVSDNKDIDEKYLERNSKTMRGHSGKIRPCRVTARLRRDTANGFSVRIFEVLPP